MVNRSFINFMALVEFTLLLPFLGGTAGCGAVEQLLMEAPFCVPSPMVVALWYILLFWVTLRRRASYLVQFLILLVGYASVVFLLRSGMVRF